MVPKLTGYIYPVSFGTIITGLASDSSWLAPWVYIPMVQAIQLRIARKDKSDESRAAIIATFDSLARRVHGRKEIEKLFREHRRSWHLLSSTTSSDLIEYLETVHLTGINLTGPGHAQERVRYGWRNPSAFDVAQSLQKNAYISHGSAAFLHGLAEDDEQQVYVNIEQSPKGNSDSELSQEGIDRAFKNKQRQTAMSYTFQRRRITVLNGKHSGRLGVVHAKVPHGGSVDLTNLERTLIDLAVRPAYAGGVEHVLEAYRRAKAHVSPTALLTTLKRLDYIYPFHQAVGFYMERAGFEPRDCERFRRLGLKFDFYLCHQMRQRVHDQEWRIYYPKGF